MQFVDKLLVALTLSFKLPVIALDKELFPKLIKLFTDMNPEAIAIQENSAKLHLFSDDGNVKYKVTQEETNEKLSNGFSSCKSLKNSNKKRFRSITININ